MVNSGMPEVNGLVGQTEGNAIVVEDLSGLSRSISAGLWRYIHRLQKSLEGFRSIIAEIERNAGG